MNMDYNNSISSAVKSLWVTKEKQGNVLAGKQLDAFLELLTLVAVDAGVPKECVYLKNNHIPGYYRATKDWDLLIISPKGNLVAAIELKSQVGSPWLGYMMVVGKDQGSAHVVKVSEPHYEVRPEFKGASYLDRYRIL